MLLNLENRELSGKMALVRNVIEKLGENVIYITKPGKIREFGILQSFRIPIKF